MKTGDVVYVTLGDKTQRGEVLIASDNGRSLVLRFEGMLGGYPGMMPVLLEADGTYTTVIGPKAVVRVVRPS